MYRGNRRTRPKPKYGPASLPTAVIGTRMTALRVERSAAAEPEFQAGRPRPEMASRDGRNCDIEILYLTEERLKTTRILINTTINITINI